MKDVLKEAIEKFKISFGSGIVFVIRFLLFGAGSIVIWLCYPIVTGIKALVFGDASIFGFLDFKVAVVECENGRKRVRFFQDRQPFFRKKE